MNTSAKHKRPIEIKDRHSGRILFETEAETLKDAVEEAVVLHVNLSCADLRNADLGGAFLDGAQLSNADFSGANLFKAVLHKSSLIGACFSSVDLRYTNIRYANLKKAVLQNSNLVGADFFRSDLTKTDFRNSNLEFVSLRGANITGISLDPKPMIPEKGSFIAWRSVYDMQGNRLIAKLLILEDTKRVIPLVGRVGRAESVKVLEFSRDVSVARCKFHPDRVYRVDEIVHAACYDDDVRSANASGIHFVLYYEETRRDHGSNSL